jgi:hypothetical protein
LANHKAQSVYHTIFDSVVNQTADSITYKYKKDDGSSIEIEVRKDGENVTVTTKN